MIQETAQIIDPTTLEATLNNIRMVVDFVLEMAQSIVSHPFVQGFVVGGGTGSMLGASKKVRGAVASGAKGAKNLVTKSKK